MNSGRISTFCDAHNREYYRRQKSRNWDGWQKVERANKRKPAALPEPQRTTPAPGVPQHPNCASALRIIAVRCAVCQVKLPYTEEYFNVAEQAGTCRRCASAQIITVVNPLDNTARRGRLFIDGEIFSCGDGAEAYAAFARAERSDGRMVVIAW
jgi:hypothetical protein